jgi:hypothetical protein
MNHHYFFVAILSERQVTYTLKQIEKVLNRVYPKRTDMIAHKSPHKKSNVFTACFANTAVRVDNEKYVILVAARTTTNFNHCVRP